METISPSAVRALSVSSYGSMPLFRPDIGSANQMREETALTSAEKTVQQGFKQALRKSFSSAPGGKHSDQRKQHHEQGQAPGYIQEHLVKLARGESDADEGSGQQREEQQETTTSAQPGPWSSGTSPGLL